MENFFTIILLGLTTFALSFAGNLFIIVGNNNKKTTSIIILGIIYILIVFGTLFYYCRPDTSTFTKDQIAQNFYSIIVGMVVGIQQSMIFGTAFKITIKKNLD